MTLRVSREIIVEISREDNNFIRASALANLFAFLMHRRNILPELFLPFFFFLLLLLNYDYA